MRAKLIEGSVGRHLLALGLPMTWGLFSIITFNLVDTYFVAQLGTQALAAISFTFPVVSILGALALGLGAGTGAVVALAIGKRDPGRVKRLATDGLLLSFIVVGIFVLIGLWTIEPLFMLLGAPPELLPGIRDYMEIWYIGMIFVVVPMVGNSIIRSTGDTVFPSLVMTIAAVVNLILDPIMIFGLLGFPRLELQGAALATVIARATTFLAAFWMLHFREKILVYRFPKLIALFQSWKQILFIGLPAAATNMIVPLSMGIVTRILADYGATAVAGYGVATRIEIFAIIVYMALGASIAPFVGQNWGAKLYLRVQSGIRMGYRFSLLWGLALAIFLGAGADLWVSFFDKNQEVMEVASSYLMIVPISYGALGIVIVCGSTFTAMGKAYLSTLSAFFRVVVFYLPLVFLGQALFGIKGIFIAGAISNVLVAIMVYSWNKRLCFSLDQTKE